MSRVMVMKKAKTIERYNVASGRKCPTTVQIIGMSLRVYCPPTAPFCPVIVSNMVLDGNGTDDYCVLEGGNPSSVGDEILGGGNPAGVVCASIASGQVLDGNRSDLYCTVDGGDPTSNSSTNFDGGNPL